jgi:phage terminase large subunit-like protein
VRPFDYIVKAGQPARQKYFAGDTLREKSANRVSIRITPFD